MFRKTCPQVQYPELRELVPPFWPQIPQSLLPTHQHLAYQSLAGEARQDIGVPPVGDRD